MDDFSPWPRFGAELRRWREARKISVTELAASIPLSYSAISRWEHGHRPVPADQVQRLDDSLGADGHLIALHAMAVDMDNLRRKVQTAASPSEDDMERRAAMQFLASLGAGALISPDTVDGIFAGIERATGERDHIDLGDWEHTVHEYGHMITRQPVGALIGDLTSDVLVVGRLLSAGNPPLVQAGLLRVGAGLSGLLATEFGDTGNQRAARIAWRAARRAADTSGDRDLSVWVRAKEASDARYVETRSRLVTGLADKAVQIAGTAPSYGLMRAHAVRASLAAEQGDHRGARAALGAFLQTFEDLPSRPQIHDDPAAFGLAEAYVRSQEALIYTLMDDAQATAAIEQALSIYPREAFGPIALLNLTQAADLVRRREIREGLGHALTTIQAMAAVTPRGRHYVERIIAALPDKARELPAARELRALMV